MSDEDGLVVARGELVYVVLNLYPYNPGHLMVVPYRRVSELEDLTDAESAELMAFTQKAIRVIKSVSQAEGFNVGLNLGKVGRRLAGRAPAHACGAALESATPTSSRSSAASKIIPQLLRETRRAAGHGVGEAAVSNFYLMTRAAYAKLSTAGGQGGAARGLTPDSITILGTAGTVLARADAVPDRPAVVGRVRRLVLRAGRHARRRDGP